MAAGEVKMETFCRWVPLASLGGGGGFGGAHIGPHI